MMRAPTVAAGVAAVLLMAGVPGAPARTPSHSCAAFSTGALRVSRIRTNLGCARAETTLQALLRNGVGGLHRRKRGARRWSCERRGDLWSCNRGARRLSFRAVAKTPAELCAGRWNADAGVVATLGYHLYLHHGVRRAWVFELPPSSSRAARRCAVVAVVPPTDPEYGADGAVTSASGPGWVWMNRVPELGDPATVQSQAPANANATLLRSGELTLP